MGCYQRPGGRRWAKRPGKSAFSQLSMLLRRAVRTWGNGRAEGGGRRRVAGERWVSRGRAS